MELLILDEMYEKKRGVRDDFKVFDLSNWKDGIVLIGENCGKNL